MMDPALPAWEGDALSRFLSEAQWNERVSALKLRDVYSLLRRVHDVFGQVTTITENENNPNLLPTRCLMARAHAAWLAKVRLGLSGHTVEASPVIRAVIEDSWYALHLARDPNPPTRAKVWLCRDDDAATKARCKTEFTITNVRATHAAVDTTTATALQMLYEWTIELGAHPNERGVLAAMTHTDPSQRGSFGAVFLTNNPTLIVAPPVSEGHWVAVSGAGGAKRHWWPGVPRRHVPSTGPLSRLCSLPRDHEDEQHPPRRSASGSRRGPRVSSRGEVSERRSE